MRRYLLTFALAVVTAAAIGGPATAASIDAERDDHLVARQQPDADRTDTPSLLGTASPAGLFWPN